MAGGIAPAETEIAEIETVTVPAGEFECYRMTFGNKPQTFWFSTDPSHVLVRLEASGVVGTLEETYSRDPKSGIQHVDDVVGFSVRTPPGWLQAPFDDQGTPKVVMLDPSRRHVVGGPGTPGSDSL